MVTEDPDQRRHALGALDVVHDLGDPRRDVVRWPSTSRPSSIAGKASAWIGVIST
jgi:hypothetical protein